MAIDGGLYIAGEIGIHRGSGVSGHEGQNFRNSTARREGRTQYCDWQAVVFDDNVDTMADYFFQGSREVPRDFGLAHVEFRHDLMIPLLVILLRLFIARWARLSRRDGRLTL